MTPFQGLGCVGVNFLSLLWYNPTLACGTKPLLVSQGGTWDPLFRPSVPAAEGWVSWFGFGESLSSLHLFSTNQIREIVAREEPPACAPQWLFFTFAIGLFVYQSLDAIDGKQARRTGTSGPLGELFDHGCDALNTTVSNRLSPGGMGTDEVGIVGGRVDCICAELGTELVARCIVSLDLVYSCYIGLT
jgi:ethanolaminephosphotransferase